MAWLCARYTFTRPFQESLVVDVRHGFMHVACLSRLNGLLVYGVEP
jgi:hypothetical protein